MKVLIVDDEPLVRLSLARALKRAGHEVSEAQDGAEGREVWQRENPDLVYLDVLMPRMSGPELLKALSGNGPIRAKVILMSAFTGEYDLAKAKQIGESRFIAKSFAGVFSVVKIGEELCHVSSKSD